MSAPFADVLIYHHGADAASADWISAALIREGYTVEAEECPARGSLAHSRNGHTLFVVLLSERLYAEPGFVEALRKLQESSAQLFPVLIENLHVGGGGQLDRINYLRLFELEHDAAEQMLLHAVRAVARGDVLGELPGNTPTVFISYSFEDADAASRIERYLRDGGYRTFRATDFLVGSEWVNRIDDALARVHVIVVLLSPAYFKSFWCYDEFSYSDETKHVLVQIADSGFDDDWRGGVEVDLRAVDDDTAGAALVVAAVAERLVKPRPRVRPELTSSWSEGPWDEWLLDRLFDPQLRMDPFQVNENWSLAARRWAHRRIDAGDF